MYNRIMKNRHFPVIISLIAFALVLTSCGTDSFFSALEYHSPSGEPTGVNPEIEAGTSAPGDDAVYQFRLDDVPEWSGEPVAVLNGNVPVFSEEELKSDSFVSYSELDELGRCGTAFACLDNSMRPEEERGDISEIRPSGWHNASYDFIDGKWLYNRCHLISFSLTGENDNEQNLITGTRYMNLEGMLPYEYDVTGYIAYTKNHVLYRSTPVFSGSEPVPRGVHLEAYSIEDHGEGISFNIFCYNVQPGVEIDYSTGQSRAAPAT